MSRQEVDVWLGAWSHDRHWYGRLRLMVDGGLLGVGGLAGVILQAAVQLVGIVLRSGWHRSCRVK